MKVKETTKASFNFLAGGGQMGTRIRKFNWSKTPLGSPDQWSSSLRATVALMLNNRFPMLLWWGKDYISIYNDAYIPVLGAKHPWGLGKPVKECWSEIWDVLQPLIDEPFYGGKATWMDDIMLIINRNSFAEETHFTIAYSPVPDPSSASGIGGVLATVNEITGQIISDRQLKTLRDIASEVSSGKTADEVYHSCSKVLKRNDRDLPFAALYEVTGNGSGFRLAAKTKRLPKTIFPDTVERNRLPEALQILSRVISTKKALTVNLSPAISGSVPKGSWEKPPGKILAIPVTHGNQPCPYAILVIGVNPFRKLDAKYRDFFSLVADQVATGLHNIKAYDDEWKRAEDLAEVDRAKTLFFTNISHEFRTPLTLMLSPIEEILHDPATSPENITRIGVAHRNAVRLLKLVNTLLDFSRIESGRQKANFVPTDLAFFTKNLAANFQSVIEQAGLEFEVATDPSLPPVYVDRQMWEIIVFNLLSNAFKYTLKGRIRLELSAHPPFVTLQVSDTGPGIPKKELPHMFERFHRVHEVGGRTFEGTGIGLSLVRDLVQLHGGSISVTSREKEGSAFTVQLPMGKEHLPAKQVTLSAAAFDNLSSSVYIDEVRDLLDNEGSKNKVRNGVPTKGKTQRNTVMVVDDNADMRTHLESLLSGSYDIVSAVNGQEALEMLKLTQPDVIVSDIMMPVLDGAGLLKKIKADPANAHIPVILLTARAGEESRIAGYETGADDYLVKPFSSLELLARIRSQLAITKKNRAALRNVYNMFLHAPYACAILLGESLIIEFVNDLTLRVWHQKREDLLGKPLFEALPATQTYGLKDMILGVLHTGTRSIIKELPVDFSYDDKVDTRFFDSIFDPLYDENGHIAGVLATGVDITEQIHVRQGIEESEKRFRQLAETLPSLVWTTHADGRYDFASKQWIEYSGMDPLDGDTWTKMVHPDDRETLTQKWQSSLQTGESYRAEARLRNRNGDFRWHFVRGEPIRDDEGRITKWCGAFIDMEEQKLREKEKDDFISIASHELKTPLTSLKGYAQILQDIFSGNGDVDSLQLLNQLDRQADKLINLTRSLLDVTGMKEGQLQLDKSLFDIDDLIREIAGSVQAGIKSHTLRTHLNTGIAIHADRERIGQVLSNLLSNAIKYSPGQDQVIIRSEREAGAVRVSVRDFGPGIAPEIQHRVFERFFRAKDDLTRTSPGLGLGLYISSEIVKKHAGTIHVTSQPGEGCIFQFTLPVITPPE